MGILKWLLGGFFGLIALLVIGLLVTDNGFIFKGLRMTYLRGNSTASLNDYEYFYNNTITKGTPQYWKEAPTYNTKELSEKLLQHHKKYNTIAFLVAKNGELLYENYWNDYGKDSQSNSFSMAKSLVTLLMDCAIQDGKIKSLNQPVGDFFPKYNKGLAAEMTVGDLSRMSSGLNWDEHYYSPFSITAKGYYKTHLSDLILTLDVVEKPGQKFHYQSGTTQLLGMVIEKATGKDLSSYLSEKFWKPMGMRHDALWSLDMEGGIEKSYCCVNANIRDFAKFGQLLLQGGQWNGQQLITRSFAEKMRKPVFPASPEYGYSLWMDLAHTNPFYFLQGHLGQYVIVLPQQNMVISRFGEGRTAESDTPEGKALRSEIYMMVDEAVATFGGA